MAMKWYRGLIAALLGLCCSSHVWGFAADGKVMVAWELWNEPTAGTSTSLKAEPKKEEPKTLESVTRQAEIARKDALRALREFQESRRLAQEAEARRLAVEQESQPKAEAENKSQPMTQSPESTSANSARKEAVEPVQPMAAQGAETQESLAEPPEQAPTPTENALEEAARERARLLAKQKAEELERLREQAGREEQRLQEEQLKARREQEMKLSEAAAHEQAQIATEEAQDVPDALPEPAAHEPALAPPQPVVTPQEGLRDSAATSSSMPDTQRPVEAEPSAAIAEPASETTAVATVVVPQAMQSSDMAAVSSVPPQDGPAAFVSDMTPDEVADYIIGSGDVLDVSVWKDESLTRSVVVSPAGTFYFPLVGEVSAAGRTVPELKADLEKKISVYVPEPVVTLELKQANSMQIYIIGRVNNPGRFLISSHVNVLQALAMAGGLNPFADEDDIKILRETGDDRSLSYEFNYKKVMRGDNLEQNIRLQRGDVIIVP